MKDVLSQTIILIKQWHLLPKVSTQDIRVSTKLAQYKNQKDIYVKVLEFIDGKKISYLLAEGCEKEEILPTFKTSFNSWNYEKLNSIKNSESYIDVLTHIPLKVEVIKKEKIKTVCVDNDALIRKNQLALSDVRAFVGYFMRLSEFKERGDKESYERFSKSLLDDSSNANVNAKNEDAIIVAKKKALDAVQELKTSIRLREEEIINNIKQMKMQSSESAAFVIGGVHAEPLQEKLISLGFKVEIYTPAGYVDTDKGLIEEITRKLQ